MKSMSVLSYFFVHFKRLMRFFSAFLAAEWRVILFTGRLHSFKIKLPTEVSFKLNPSNALVKLSNELFLVAWEFHQKTLRCCLCSSYSCDFGRLTLLFSFSKSRLVQGWKLRSFTPARLPATVASINPFLGNT